MQRLRSWPDSPRSTLAEAPAVAIVDCGSLLPKRVRPDVISRKGQHVGKDQNTYAKRQREMSKRRKAEDKRVRRQKRKEQGPAVDTPESSDPLDASVDLVGTAGLQSRPGAVLH